MSDFIVPSLNMDMFRFYRELRVGEFILLFVDTAGEGSDRNARHNLSKSNLDIPIVMHYEGSIVDVTPQLKILLEWIYLKTKVKPVVCYETNTNSATRPVMLNGVEELINNQLVTIYDEPTINEGFSFVKHKTPSGWKAEAESGATDDLIMSLAGVWQMYQTENPPVVQKYVQQYKPTNFMAGF